MPASASTDINADKLAEFFVEKVQGVRAATSNVLPCRRRMFAMMHLHNFCQVSIEEVRQVMTRSAVKSSDLDRNSEGRWLKIGEWSQLELRTPVKNSWLRHCIAIFGRTKTVNRAYCRK